MLTIYITVNSVCWSLIEKSSYEVVDWTYQDISYPRGKKMQISDILDIVSKHYLKCNLIYLSIYIILYSIYKTKEIVCLYPFISKTTGSI